MSVLLTIPQWRNSGRTPAHTPRRAGSRNPRAVCRTQGVGRRFSALKAGNEKTGTSPLAPTIAHAVEPLDPSFQPEPRPRDSDGGVAFPAGIESSETLFQAPDHSSMDSADGQPMDRRVWIDFLNDSSKWVAVAGCAAAVVVFHDRHVLWFSVGMVCNAFLAKLLKRLLRQQRPEGAHGKDDYGMPSSHAQSLGFLGTYSTLACFSAFGSSPASVAFSSAILALTLLMIWTRVQGGLHTFPQVLVGAAVGFTDASIWKASFDMFSRGIDRGAIAAPLFDTVLLLSFCLTLGFAAWRELTSRRKKKIKPTNGQARV